MYIWWRGRRRLGVRDEAAPLFFGKEKRATDVTDATDATDATGPVRSDDLPVRMGQEHGARPEPWAAQPYGGDTRTRAVSRT